MTKKYYYLVASLPYLEFNKDIAINKAKFLEECEKWLTPKDFELLSSADICSETAFLGTTDLFRTFKEKDDEITKELAAFREARRRGEEPRVEGNIRIAVEQENPLLMEREIEKIRWDYFEEVKTGHYFDINFLVIYFLQLQLMERLAGFDKDKGESYFYKLCEVNYDQVCAEHRHGHGHGCGP